jgi:hypothetical protein
MNTPTKLETTPDRSFTPINAAERARLLDLGQAWVDVSGRLLEGQPDDATIFAALNDYDHRPRVKAALARANEAAIRASRSPGCEQAEAEYLREHRAVHVAAVRELSLANYAPHQAAHDERINAFFDQHGRTP